MYTILKVSWYCLPIPDELRASTPEILIRIPFKFVR